MTIKREEAKELLPIIQAFADGKHIQWRNHCKNWIDIDERDGLNTEFPLSVYRIKPEKKYRPFKTKKECWDEMMKHQPFGWLFRKTEENYNSIGCITEYNGFVYLLFATKEDESFTAEFLLKNYKFADGTPFGIEEEEKDNRIN